MEGTPLDFHTPCRVGDRMQLAGERGYDHNYCLNTAPVFEGDDKLRWAATYVPLSLLTYCVVIYVHCPVSRTTRLHELLKCTPTSPVSSFMLLATLTTRHWEKMVNHFNHMEGCVWRHRSTRMLLIR